MRYAIINNNNLVISVVVWAGGEFRPPRNHILVQSDVAQPGYIYDPKQEKFYPAGIKIEG